MRKPAGEPLFSLQGPPVGCVWLIESSIKTTYEVRDGQPVILRLPGIDFIDAKAGTPVGIQKLIFRRPVAAFGHSNGDFQMLEWTTSGRGARFGLIVHHTDSSREYAYDRESSVSRLGKGLDAAKVKGWAIVGMEKDWKRVFR